jgi:hypothetical protein
MGDFSRARDITIVVARQQGAPLTLRINSGTLDHGLQSEEIPLVGEDVARVEGINGPVSMQLDTNSADISLFELILQQRDFNAGVANNDTHRISCTFTMALPNGTRIKLRMTKCTLHTATHAFTGSTERTTSPFTIAASRMVRVA